MKVELTSQSFAANHAILPSEFKVKKRFEGIKAQALRVIDERIKERKPETKNQDVLDYYVEALLKNKT